MRKIYALLFTVVLFVSASVNAQTTYTWATPGTGGDFQVGTNWTPNGVPVAGDNIIINPSASITVSNVPAVVLNNFSVTPTATSTLTLTAAAANILGVSGSMTITGTAAITATVAISTNVTLAISGAGTVTMNTGSAFSGSLLTNFTFAAGTALNYARDGGTIPLAGYNAASTVNVTGITATTPSAPASMGNFIWNCTNQANLAATLSSVPTSITGSATINSTGSAGGGFQWGISTVLTITGAYTINNNSIVNSAGGTITCNGGLVLNSGASLNGSGATTYNIGTGTNINLASGSFVTGASAQTFVMAGTGAQTATFNALISGVVNLTVNATTVATLGSSVTLNSLTVVGGGSLATSGGQTITVNSAATLGTATTNGTVSGGANFTVNAGGSLTIAGTGAAIQSGGSALGVSGTVSVLSGAITINGTAAQTFGSNFPTPLTIGIVTINNAAGVTVDKTVSINALTITAGVTTISGGIILTVNGATTISSNIAGILSIAGTFTQAAGTITFGTTSTSTGAGTFNLNSGATLATANTGGIAASAATGSVQTTIRNFNTSANYTFTGGATGDGMPLTVAGNVTIGTSTNTIGAAYTFNGSFTSTVSLVITSPNSITIGTTGIATHSSGTTVTGTGSYITLSGSTLNIATASTTNGLFPAAAAGSGLFQPTTLTISTGTNVFYTGTTAGIPMGTRSPSNLATIGITSTGSLTLAAPLTVTNLSFTSTGFINTTATNILTVTGTATNSVSRTTTSTTGGFVLGPLARQFPANYTAGNSMLYPIGKTATYEGFELINPITGAGGTYTITMESFLTAPTGGTLGTGLSGALAAFYWQATVAGAGSLTSVSNIRVAHSSIVSTQKIGQSATVGGAYNSIGGTFTVGASLLSGLTVGSFASGTFFGVATGAASGTFTAGTYAIGPSGPYGGYVATYTSITSALAAMAENTALGAAVILELQTDYVSTVEGYPLNVTSAVPTTASNTVTIRPASAVSAIINFNPTGGNITAIFDFNGGKNFIVDGRNGGSGTNQYIGINNLGNGPALRLINDGQNNIFRYIVFTAANTSTTSGVVLFSTTAVGALAANGNNSNTIDNCNINANGVSPNGIYASGTVSPADNKSNIITNNKVLDFFTSGSTCIGINLQAGNTLWNIGTAGNGNSIYQTSTRVPAATTAFRGILINNTSGNGFSIVGNTIGGSIPGIGGSVFNIGSSTQINTIANNFYPIRLDVGTTTATSVQGNTISNINLFSSATSGSTFYFVGIFVNVGLVNIGDVTANTIGSTTSTGNINFTFRGTGTGAALVEGIRCGNATVYNGGSINNNLIGGFTTSADFALTTAVTFNGIAVQSTGLTATTSVNGNTIGSTTIANNIQHSASAQMPSTQNGISFIATSLAAGGVTVQNNTIANITNLTSFAYSNNFMVGINNSGTAVTTGPMTISGNTVRNLTTSSTNPTLNSNVSTIVGLAALSTVTGTALYTISNNTFHSFTNTTNTASAVSVLGMFYNAANTGGSIVERNLIHSLNTGNSNTVATQSGIFISSSSGAATTLRNNMIRLGINIDGSSNTASTFINGIMKTNTNAHNIFFNSVYIGGSTVVSGTVNSSTFYKSTASGADDIRNNIFMNARSNTSGTGKHYAINLNGTTSITSNYNDLFISGTGGNIGTNGTTNYTTFSSWKTGTSLDLNSYNGDPQFIAPTGTSSTGDLHIHPTNPTQIEAAGIDIGSVTIDYDGQTRSGLTPVDIGADAGNFVAQDITAPAISYTALSNSSCTTSRVLTNFATITDASLVNVTVGTKPRLYYKASGDANSFDDNTNTTDGWKFVEATNTTSPFSFTMNYSLLLNPVTGGQTIQYFVVAQDLVTPTPNVGINSGVFNSTPSNVNLGGANFPITGTINSFTIVAAGLSATVTIGVPASTYPTITGVGGLFEAINSNGLSGNLIANIIDASITENGAVALNTVTYTACSGGPFTITIKPNTTATLTGSVSSAALIRLNGADYVTIDGSNNGSTSRDLTITNSATTAPTAISLISLGTGLGATNNTIKNCNISTGVQITTGYGIAIGGATPGGTGPDNDNVIIQNNSITACVVGIYAQGTSITSTGGNDNLSVTGNTVTYNSNLASNVGINVNNSLTSSINQNTVSITTTATSGTSIAMQLAGTTGATVSQNSVSVSTAATTQPVGISIETNFVSSTVTRNLITQVLTTATGGYGGRGITVGTGTASSSLTIANNVIYGVNGSNWNLFGNSSSMGIAIGMIGGSGTLTTTTGGVNLYFNSVSMTGSMGTGSTTALTTALYVGSGASALNIRDNIFANTQVGTNASQKNYAIYSAVANTAYTTINHNDYFVSNTFNAGSAIPGFLTTDRVDLAGIQLGFGQNVNSIIANPLFTSNTDLRPGLGSPVGAAGENPNITGITTDYLNTARGTPPTIGAYETLIDAAGPVITYTALGNTNLLTNRAFGSVTITDVSGVNTTAGTMPRLYYKKSTSNNTYAGNTNLDNGWKFVEANGATSPFDFTIDYSKLLAGAVSVGDIIQYFVVAQDLAATPNISINSGIFTLNPTSVNLTSAAFPITGTINQYLITASISGTITVPGTYASLTLAGGAFEAINNATVTGNITIEIAGDLTLEIGTNALNAFASPFTVTIQPTGGVLRTISGSAAGAVIKLNGADRVTINGLNTGGNALTISNTNTVATTAVIWNASLGAGLGATNNTISNCTITNGSSAVLNFGIAVSGATIGSNGADNDDVTIQGNTISACATGIYAIGTATVSSGGLDNLNINNNSVTTNTSVTSIGIQLGNALNASISQNTLDIQQSATNAPVGISLETGFNTSTVTKNKIVRSFYTGSAGYGGRGITIGTGSATSALTISNNVIYGVTGDNFSSFTNSSSMGICIGTVGGSSTLTTTTGGINLYNNSVNMYGDYSRSLSACITAALYVGTGASALDIRNNVFVNSLNNTTNAGSKAYAIYSAAANTAFTTINYNEYFVSGTQGVLGFLTSDRTDLAGIVTGFGGNANSYNADPSFTSTTNLLPVANIFPSNYRLGTNISGLTTDYSGTTRSNPPDIGAYEGVDANRWIGATNTTWATNSNWDNGTAAASNQSVTIASNNLNNPVLGADVIVNGLAINGTASTLAIGSNTLTINGAVSSTGTGTISGSSTSNLTISGGVNAGTINLTQTNASTRSLNNFLVLNASSSATLGSALNVYGALGALFTGSLNLNGNSVTLKAGTYPTTARIVDLSVSTLSGASNVTTERFIPAGKRAYRQLASGVTTTNFISNNWQLAMHVTGNVGTAGTTDGTTGFDNTQTGQKNMYTYTPGAANFTGIANTNNTNLNALTGYRVFVMGDRTSSDLTVLNNTGTGTPNIPSTATTIKATGTLLTGTQTFTGAQLASNVNDYALIPNPYWSPVDWDALTKSNVASTYWIWDPSIGNRGAYTSWTTGSGPSGGGAITKDIQPGQAIFVQTSVASPSIAFNEANKTSIFTSTFRPVGQSPSKLVVSLLGAYGTNPAFVKDATTIAFRDDFSTAILATEDAQKFTNTDENIAIMNTTTALGLEARSTVANTDIIPVRLWKLFDNNTYSLKLNAQDFDAGIQAYLRDKKLNTQTAISMSGETTYPFTFTSTDSSSFYNRFEIVFNNTTALPANFTNIKAYRKNTGIQVEWDIAAETAIKNYEVQRSENADGFTTVASVTAIANNGKAVNYDWFDANPFKTNNYYRIKVVGANGEVKYSSIVKVGNSKETDKVSVYPNPLEGNVVTLQLGGIAEGKYEIQLFSSTGQQMMSSSIVKQGAVQTQTLSLPKNMSAGVYRLSIRAEDGTIYNRNIIKL